LKALKHRVAWKHGEREKITHRLCHRLTWALEKAAKPKEPLQAAIISRSASVASVSLFLSEAPGHGTALQGAGCAWSYRSGEGPKSLDG